MHHNPFTTMRSLKLAEGCKGTQVYALNPPPPPGGVGDKLLQHLQDHLRVNSIRSKSSRTYHHQSTSSSSLTASPPPISSSLRSILP
ncbi:hypothetical protein HID58_090673 [Brassica napus]|uniref:DET1- and DDB1-associated protein 1 n=1 Tax=Brassica napus TaxID=3708 RepID=A0ABQ7XBG4_BRANA|nr:hypothetical protein HID58_090673 [Brassica napus]